MDSVIEKLDSLVFQQYPRVPNSVSIRQLTTGSSQFQDHWRDPAAIFHVLSICVAACIKKMQRHNLPDSVGTAMSKETVCQANAWMAVLGYQAEVGETEELPQGAIYLPVNNERALWFRHKDHLGEDILSGCADRSLVKYLSSPPTLDGPFAWFRSATLNDPQRVAGRQLVEQLSEASRFFLGDKWSPNWMLHSYEKLVPHMNACLIKTTLMTPEDVQQQKPFFQDKHPSPTLLKMDAAGQHFMLLEVSDLHQEAEGPGDDESEDMMSKLKQMFAGSLHVMRPGSPMKRVR